MYHKQVYFLLNKDTYLRFSVPPFKEAKSKYELKNSNYLIFVICNSSQGFVNWMSLEWVVSKTKSSRFLVTYKMFMPRFYLILSSSVSSLFVSLSEKEFLAYITVIKKSFLFSIQYFFTSRPVHWYMKYNRSTQYIQGNRQGSQVHVINSAVQYRLFYFFSGRT